MFGGSGFLDSLFLDEDREELRILERKYCIRSIILFGVLLSVKYNYGY